MPGRISAANRAATDQPSGSPSSAASSSHSASVTGARYCGCSSRLVLGQEPREQQPVPLLVGALRDQQLPIAARAGATSPASPLPQRRLLRVEMLRPAVREHAETLDRRARRALRRAPSSQHRRLELLAQCRGESAHIEPQMMTVLLGVEVGLHARRAARRGRRRGRRSCLNVADGGVDGRRSRARASWRRAGAPGRAGRRRG